MLGAQGAYDQVYDDQRPRHEVTHELLAGAAGFEAMRMYEHHRENEGITEHHELGKELLGRLRRRRARRAPGERLLRPPGPRAGSSTRPRRQANYLYDQQCGQYDPNYDPQYAAAAVRPAGFRPVLPAVLVLAA